MTLHQVGIFRDVAQHLNFTRAAHELHLSQPSASMQIQPRFICGNLYK